MTDSSSSKVEAAKDQAAGLKDEALASGQHVAQTAADQAGSVVGEAKVQAKDLFGQAQSELRDQAGTQQQRVASGLRSVSDELSSMAGGSESGGMAADLVQQAAGRVGSIAGWLEGRDPGTLLSDVRAYAARKPGTFIAVAAIAGVVAGRLTRSLAGNAKDEKDAAEASTPASSASVAPVAPTTFEPSTVESTYAAPAYTSPLYAEPVTNAGIDPTLADPTYAEPTAAGSTSAGTAPIDDVTLHAHSVDDEYGDSATVESLFDEPAEQIQQTEQTQQTGPSFDETLLGDDYRGDDYRGERS